MLSKLHRLKQSSRIKYIYRAGTPVHNAWFVVNAIPNNLEHSRFAFVASKKVGGAVIRNRVVRRLRHIIIQYLEEIPAGYDFVIVTKPQLINQKIDQITDRLMSSIRRVTSR